MSAVAPLCISSLMSNLTPNPTFRTWGLPISFEPPSITSWLNHWYSLLKNLFPCSHPRSLFPTQRAVWSCTTHPTTSLFCPKPSHHFPLTRGKASLYKGARPSINGPSVCLWPLPLDASRIPSSPPADHQPSRHLSASGPCSSCPPGTDSTTRLRCLSTVPF